MRSTNAVICTYKCSTNIISVIHCQFDEFSFFAKRIRSRCRKSTQNVIFRRNDRDYQLFILLYEIVIGY